MRAMFVILACLVLCASLAAIHVTQTTELFRTECVDHSNHNSLALVGDYLYLVTSRGLSIYHREADSLSWVNEMPNESGYTIRTIAAYNGMLFVARHGSESNLSGIQRYNLENPTTPELEESVNCPRGDNMMIDGDRLFYYTGQTGGGRRLKIVNPLFFAMLYAEYSFDGVGEGLRPAGTGYAIDIANGGHGNAIHIFDISNELIVHEMFSVPIGNVYSNWKARFFCAGDCEYLFINLERTSLTLLDITDHDQPETVWEIDGGYLDYEMGDDRVAHVLTETGVMGVDFSDPTQPDTLYTLDLPNTFDICCAEGLIATAGSSLALRLPVDGALETVAQRQHVGAINDNAFSGRFLYVGAEFSSMLQFDLADPAPNPPVRPIELPPGERSYLPPSFAGDRLVLNSYTGDYPYAYHTRLFNVSENGVLTLIEQFSDSVYTVSSLRSETEMFMCHPEMVSRYSVSDSGAQFIDQLPIPVYAAHSIDFHQSYLCIASWERFCIVSAFPDEPMEVTYDMSHGDMIYPTSLFFDDYMLYSSSTTGYASFIFSMSDPANLELLCTIDDYGVAAVDADNNLLFLGAEDCIVYDLTPLLNTGSMPEPVGFIPLSNDGMGYYALPNDRLLAVTRTGVELIDYDPLSAAPDPIPSPALALTTYPNPFNPTTTLRFELPAPGRVRMEVFNIRGQRVATLLDEHRESGAHSVVWDAEGAASGVYFARIRCNGAGSVHKLALVR